MADKANEKKVKVKLPLKPGQKKNQSEFFSVNGKNYLIKRGEYVEVPEALAEVIRNGEEAEQAAIIYAADNAVKEPKQQ